MDYGYFGSPNEAAWSEHQMRFTKVDSFHSSAYYCYAAPPQCGRHRLPGDSKKYPYKKISKRGMSYTYGGFKNQSYFKQEGAGMSGMRAATVFFIGLCISWGVIAPLDTQAVGCNATNNLYQDEDGDGLPNGQELAQHLPACGTNANYTPGITAGQTVISSENRLTITFRARELPDLSYGYQVQESSDLINWTDVNMYQNRIGISNASDSGGTFDLVTIHTGLAQSNYPEAFMRVRFINPWPTPSELNATVSLTNIVPHTRNSIFTILPSNTLHKQVYDSYSSTTNCEWSRFSWVNRVDLSGLASDSPRSCTLISPLHVLMVAHSPRLVNSTVVFHTREGEKVERTLTASILSSNSVDVAVGLLDAAITNIPFYKVLPPRTNWNTHLTGALGVVTRYNFRAAIIRRVNAFNHGVHGTSSMSMFIDPDIPFYYGGEVTSGDSGNPSFLLIRGEPVLIHMVAQVGAWGPFIGDTANYQSINQYMTQLGGGYQLTPIVLDP